MTRTAGAQIGCQRPSRFWGLGCPKIYHEAEDTLVQSVSLELFFQRGSQCVSVGFVLEAQDGVVCVADDVY
ncbi:hypothetical protein, partial [Thiolapillus sp.]